MSYLEIIKPCYDKYDYFHNTACCYRADIVSCEGETFTVEWTQGKPKDAKDKTANVKTSYGCGWCLAPFLGSENVIMPFCPGSHVLVLNNNLSLNASEWSPDRFLIIGFDETFYNPGSNDALKPCIPNNLGFYFSNARYGAPYYIEKNKDDNGQIECTPINTWEEGGITLPRGTENNHGEIITIATSTGEITAIKPFQIPGFNLLAALSETLSVYNCLISGKSPVYTNVVLQVLLGSNGNLSVVVIERPVCMISGEELQNTSFAKIIGSFPSTAVLVLGHALYQITDLISLYTQIQYNGNQNTFPVNDISRYIYICVISGIPKKITVTKGVDGTFSSTQEDIGGGFSFTKNVTGYSGAELLVGHNGGSASWTTDYSITGSSLLATNENGFNLSKTANYIATSREATDDGRDSSGVGTITWDRSYLIDSLVTYSVGSYSWENKLNSSAVFNFYAENPYLGQICSGSGHYSAREEHTTPFAVDVKSNISLVLRKVITMEADFDPSVFYITVISGGSITASNVTTYFPIINVTVDIYIELITPLGTITLEHDSFGFTHTYGEEDPSRFRSIEPRVFYPDVAGDPRNVAFLWDIPFCAADSLFSSFDYGVTRTEYNLGMNMFFMSGAHLTVAMDKRQVKVAYTKNGVTKNRIFVDNIERFLKENPNHWTSTDILNR